MASKKTSPDDKKRTNTEKAIKQCIKLITDDIASKAIDSENICADCFRILKQDVENFFNEDFDSISGGGSGSIRGVVAITSFMPKLDEFSKDLEVCADTNFSEWNEEVRKIVVTHMAAQIDWLAEKNKKADTKSRKGGKKR